MKKLVYSLIVLLLPITLAGCDTRIAKLYLSEIYCSLPFTCSGKDRVGLDLRDVNYTDYKTAGIAVQSPDENDMRAAASGGVSWKKNQKPPVTIKVWWQVIYDKPLWDKGGYDREVDKRPAPGTVWCEAIVNIKEPYPVYDVSHLYLYFFPDGHVEAELGGLVVDTQDPYRRMKDSEREYTDAQKAAFPRRHDGKYCDKYIDNPWFGVDTSNPWV